MIRLTLEKKEFIRVWDDGAAKSLNRFRNRYYPIWRGTDPGRPEVKNARKRPAGLKGSNIHGD